MICVGIRQAGFRSRYREGSLKSVHIFRQIQVFSITGVKVPRITDAFDGITIIGGCWGIIRIGISVGTGHDERHSGHHPFSHLDAYGFKGLAGRKPPFDQESVQDDRHRMTLDRVLILRPPLPEGRWAFPGRSARPAGSFCLPSSTSRSSFKSS